MTALTMCGVAFFRVKLLHRGSDERVGEGPTAADNATAITLSLFTIVMMSVIIGCMLPIVILWCGMDPAHAGPSIQVCGLRRGAITPQRPPSACCSPCVRRLLTPDLVPR